MSNSVFNVYVSNRLENLVKQLAGEIRTPHKIPLEPDLIIVQSQGMARWVSMQLAEQNRICANTHFPFPNAFLSYLCRKLLPDTREDRLFESDAMAFRIMAILPHRLHKPEYSALQTYLADDPQGIKLFQLAVKIADLFDQYLIFRTDMIRNWDRNINQPDEIRAWQADLWQAVKTSKECIHRAEMQQRLLETLMVDNIDSGVLPSRISAFGISHLPRFHTEIMAAVSQHLPVHLYLMNPCQEYWGEIVTRRDIRKIRTHYESKGEMSEDLHLDKGNSILSTMGNLGRDFLSMVSELECVQLEIFERPDGQTMLSQIQADIFDLYEPGSITPADKNAKAELVSDSSNAQFGRINDNSICIYACHSPMREVEILYDQILAMLQEDPVLVPRDILVMIPDIEAYSSYITAVFGTVDDGHMRIPYSIADRSALNSSPVIEGFLAILGLTMSRMEVGRILDILTYDAIREKFAINESDLPRIEEWIGDLNIRWGKDAQAISRLGLPPGDENTWRSGMERMLMGMAMIGNDQHLFAGSLPYDNLEGADTLLLGNFLEFIESLFHVCSLLEAPQLVSQWSQTLTVVLDRMFVRNDAYARDLQTLQFAIDTMQADASVAEFNVKLNLMVIKSYLSNALERESASTGFILGGVTFCAMLPMRSIPFKAICLLGMNSDAFPRDSKAVSFDLMASHPRLGDRSRRDDDKYLFLEALISAREKLYISYIGQSIQDNTRLVPSVLVSELVDYIEDRFGVDATDLIQYHPLQAFSHAYFSESSTFFSFSRENFEAVAQVKSADRLSSNQSVGISIPPDEWLQVDIDSLCRFFCNPIRFLLQRRLGIALEDEITLLDDYENFRLAHLHEYQLAEELLHHYVKGRQPEDLKVAVQARGILPHGDIGQFEFKRMCSYIRQFADKMKIYSQGLQAQQLSIDYELGRFSINGMIPEIYGDTCVYARYTRFNPGDLIRVWIYHLIRSSTAPKTPANSWYVARDTTIELLPLKDSESILLSLLDLFWQGLSDTIHFFPFVSHAYAKQVVQQAVKPEKALQAVQNKWNNDFGWSESENSYISLCFKNKNPLDDRFEDLAISVYGPILKNIRELKG